MMCVEFDTSPKLLVIRKYIPLKISHVVKSLICHTHGPPDLTIRHIEMSTAMGRHERWWMYTQAHTVIYTHMKRHCKNMSSDCCFLFKITGMQSFEGVNEMQLEIDIWLFPFNLRILPQFQLTLGWLILHAVECSHSLEFREVSVSQGTNFNVISKVIFDKHVNHFKCVCINHTPPDRNIWHPEMLKAYQPRIFINVQSNNIDLNMPLSTRINTGTCISISAKHIMRT